MQTDALDGSRTWLSFELSFWFGKLHLFTVNCYAPSMHAEKLDQSARLRSVFEFGAFAYLDYGLRKFSIRISSPRRPFSRKPLRVHMGLSVFHLRPTDQEVKPTPFLLHAWPTGVMDRARHWNEQCSRHVTRGEIGGHDLEIQMVWSCTWWQ